MVSTTSGTTSFNLDVDEIIEEALDPLGGEYTSGIEAAKARRTLNLILIDLQNKNIPLNKIDTTEVSLTDGDAEYVLNASVVDVLKATLLVDETETPLTRESLKYYHSIPNKSLEQRPTLYCTERGKDAVTVKVWPIPDADSTYTLKLLVSKRIEDVTASYQKLDISYRYLPYIIKCLSYELSLHRQNIAADIRQELKARYEEVKDSTFEEDRERADATITIGGVDGW